MATEQQERLKIEQLRQHSADELEHIEGRERENLERWIPTLASEAEVREALEKAFDYRGDVTLTLKDGRTINGYIFDRRTGATLADSVVRVIPANERTKVTVAIPRSLRWLLRGATRRPGHRSGSSRRAGRRAGSGYRRPVRRCWRSACRSRWPALP